VDGVTWRSRQHARPLPTAAVGLQRRRVARQQHRAVR
jgi:hypothetical protein